ncbi:MAG: hypothetical protein JSW28_09670 [Thermoplasmata archaeon]|nr:MAG: hypothetical protein JSW28_09670 [Thermoplasmata archaeon]
MRDDIFQREDGLWWLREEKDDMEQWNRTPMAIALKNGNISGVIDSKRSGLSPLDGKQNPF